MTEGVPCSPLLTDYYQLTMMEAYLRHDMTQTAVFEFFVRKLPDQRRFLMAAGLEQVLEFLEQLRFSSETLDWLERHGHASRTLIDYLAGLRFTGDVDAMAEGTVFFADEPVLRITAPLPVAQLVESRVMNLLHFQCMIASKAARMVLAAPGKRLVDFGLRRAHGAEAGLLAARAAYVAGFDGTATVLAGQAFGIPLYGTMAHSFILAHGDELAAFEDFVRIHPDNTILLIDTYDTRRGAQRVVELAERLRGTDIRIRGVRIDSGDLDTASREVRAILDAAGLHEVTIFASGNLDESRLARLQRDGAPIDGFGVGTRMDVSDDAPYLECAYKLQEYAGQPRRKRSEGKATWPGSKQVYRRHDEHGQLRGDLIALASERAEGEPLLQPVMRGGQRVAPAPGLAAARAHGERQLAGLPAMLRDLAPGPADGPAVSDALRALARQLDATG
ncbi:nicotinate phosphoribosyltransferase [Acidihalobacter prosperus]|uniref:Nicotinate phosphoribosyltransferase n=1 Tax=Acidihalobacter prosperus TaxID=160660 RepID=A0A1A6C5T1_9GAMM|nr:nicotinate phosphoribosyltransferase [Acidihalobacter prosperus]OBS09895.1 nicotinate phosphoribosyltransferase [Acidihalobacter prosperus]